MTEGILFVLLFEVKRFLHPATRHKKPHVYAHNFSISFFSSSGTHQPHHLNGCQEIGVNPFLICTFRALRFYTHCTTQKIYHHHSNNHHSHPMILFVVELQTNQEQILGRVDIFNGFFTLFLRLEVIRDMI